MKKYIGKVITALVLLISFATLAFASQLQLLVPTTYVSAGTVQLANVLRSPNQGSITVITTIGTMSGVPTAQPIVQGITYSGTVYTLCTGNVISASNTQSTISVGAMLTAVSGVACNMPLPDQWNVKYIVTQSHVSDTISIGTDANTAQ